MESEPKMWGQKAQARGTKMGENATSLLLLPQENNMTTSLKHQGGMMSLVHLGTLCYSKDIKRNCINFEV